MAQKRKKLSTNPKNVRARERRAELRAKKKRRSEAAIKGWVTRTREKLQRITRPSDSDNQRTDRHNQRPRHVDKTSIPNDRKILRKARKKKSNKELIKELERQDKEIAEKNKKITESREEKELLDAAIAEFDEIARNMFFGEVPVEDRVKRMQMLWPEVDALTVRKGASRRDALMAWVQRNMFDIPEFWSEYRRRKG